MRAWPLLCLVLAACGAADGNNATTDQIERLSTPENLVEDVSNSARLEPLGAASDADCTFSGDGGTLLAVSGGIGSVRLNGAPRDLVPSGPVGPSGGFFEDRQVSVSVGRTGEGDRLTVTNRRTEVQQQISGVWRCGERP